VTSIASKTWDMLRLIRRGGPALCNVAVTNSCNAACDFCNFAPRLRPGSLRDGNLTPADAHSGSSTQQNRLQNGTDFTFPVSVNQELNGQGRSIRSFRTADSKNLTK
jgi:hypothetical protein